MNFNMRSLKDGIERVASRKGALFPLFLRVLRGFILKFMML